MPSIQPTKNDFDKLVAADEQLRAVDAELKATDAAFAAEQGALRAVDTELKATDEALHAATVALAARMAVVEARLTALEAAPEPDPAPDPAPPPTPGPVPVPTPEPLPPMSPGDHGYFTALQSHSKLFKAWSLRDHAQLAQHSTMSVPKNPQGVTYLPDQDTYPLRQDAAKAVIVSDSLTNQIQLPIDVVGGSTLITWDAWYGPEFLPPTRGSLNIHKAFQVMSPYDGSGRWWEIRNNYLDGDAGSVATIDARGYGQPRGIGVPGPNERMQPLLTRFQIAPARWTREWALVEARDGDDDRLSLWAADTQQAPVQIYDQIPMNLAPDGRIVGFWLQLNSSATRDPGLGPLVVYLRNVVVLRHITLADIPALLVAPQ